ncbi:MAG: diguanylate cyclase [Burkholderiales bacterium]|nr:diguanylate cyclase [Burkholderiales bacterium]
MIRLGLTSRLSILLVCIGVAASGATGYYSYRANRAMLIQEAEHSLLTSTQFLTQRFTAALGDVAGDVLVLSALPSSVAVARGEETSRAGRARIEQVFLQFMTHHPEYLQIRLITRSHHGLERIRVERGAQGIVVAGEGEFREKGQFPYVFDTLATMAGHVYLSPIGLTSKAGANVGGGKPAMTVGAPIVDLDGSKVGVLVIDIDLTQVFQRLGDDLRSGYEIYLANEWGDFLMHPDPNQTFGFERGRRVLMQASFPATGPLFGGGATTNVTFDVAAPAGRVPAQAFAFVRSPFGLVDGNRFIVLGLGRSLTTVLASANVLGQQIVRMVLIWSAFAIVLAILFARALARPLRVLAHAATHIFDEAGGEGLPVSRSDEIGVLARCFEGMRFEIRSQMKTLHAKQRELAHLAGHDTLTGLPNRMRFLEQLETAIAQATHTAGRLAVIFVDLDGFKQINDRLGHSAGDRTLTIVAQRLRAALPDSCIVARLGGDEFVILVTGVRSPDEIPHAVRCVQAALDEPVTLDAHRVKVGASMGISEFPADGNQAEDLLAKADAAMYGAKMSPHCRHLCYQELMVKEAFAGRSRISKLA